MIAAERRSYAYGPGGGAAPDRSPQPRSESRVRPQPSGRMSRAEFSRWLATLAVLAALGTGATAATSAVASAGYRVDKLSAALHAAMVRENALQAEVGQAESLAGVQQRATRLGMRRPDAYQMVRPVPVQPAPRPLGRSVTVTLPKPPPPATGATSPLVSARLWLQRLAGWSGSAGGRGAS
jgi:hypothetical protein